MKTGKRAVSVLLAVLACITCAVLAGCQPAAQPEEEATPAPTAAQAPAAGEEPAAGEGALTAGAYEAAAMGRNGELTVRVECSDEAILSVEVVEHTETAGVADGALERVPAAVVEHQTLSVDAVAGATITSEAILTAVSDCLEQAGADPADWTAAVGEAGCTQEARTAQVVVVGAGVSGLSAAISAKEAGLDVLVVEKLDRTGGSAVFCSGNFAAVNTASEREQGIEDSVGTALQHWEERQSQSIEDMGMINYDRIAWVLEETAATIDWYAGLGMEFEPSTAPSFGNLSTTRAVGRGQGLVDKMTEIANSLEIEILFETPAVELIAENGAVTGVVAQSADVEYTITADAVVLATGGYAADAQELAEKVPLFANAVSLASAGNTGDGIEMAVAVGAVEYAEPWAIPYTIQPAPQIKAQVPEASILTDNRHDGIFVDKAIVNEDGERFVDESQQYSVVSVNMAYSSEKNFLILDSSDAELSAVLDECLATGMVFKGETLEELAANAGIGGALNGTIAQYNADVAAGQGDTLFGKAAEKMTAYGEGPYYAVVYFPGTTGSIGGVVTDYESHVLDAGGAVIPGLYAVGEMSNREYYNQTYIGASSVSFSATNGRLVGKLIAEELA